jgi:hypothetical protein
MHIGDMAMRFRNDTPRIEYGSNSIADKKAPRENQRRGTKSAYVALTAADSTVFFCTYYLFVNCPHRGDLM